MAGIYSQGGSAGHRYAGWLETVEAKNFIFGGKVFNGSPSAIYVGSNLVWMNGWLEKAARQAIMDAFLDDGMAVIAATNAYLDGIAASDMDKATALAGFINEDPMMVCSLGLEVEGVTMPIRWLVKTYSSNNDPWMDSGIAPTTDMLVTAKVLKNSGSNQYCCYFGSRISGTQGQCFIASLDETTINYGTYGGRVLKTASGGEHIVGYDMVRTKGILDGEEFNANSGSGLATLPMYIMALNNGGSLASGDSGGMAELHIVKTNNEWRFVPFISRTQGMGMVDLVNMEFHPNQGTGHFTDAYTLQDGVTPWTPSTP